MEKRANCAPNKECSESCPIARVYKEHVDRHRQQEDELILAAVGDESDTLAAEIAEHIRAELDQRPYFDGHGPSPEAIALEMRRIEGEELQELQKHIKNVEEDLSHLTSGCEGRLTMRAKKLGRVITVSVCASPSIPLDATGEPKIEPTVVKRTTA